MISQYISPVQAECLLEMAVVGNWTVWLHDASGHSFEFDIVVIAPLQVLKIEPRQISATRGGLILMTLSRNLVHITGNHSCSVNGVRASAICNEPRLCSCFIEAQNSGLFTSIATFDGFQLTHQIFIEIVSGDSEFELIPTFGASAGGSLITVQGTMLSNESAVFIGGVRCQVSLRTGHQIVATTPVLQSNQSYVVSVFNPVLNIWTKSSEMYLSVDEPYILNVFPSFVPSIKASVTITASNLFLTISKCVFGDDDPVQGRLISDDRMVCVVDLGPIGNISLSVYNSLQEIRNRFELSAVEAPKLLSITPSYVMKSLSTVLYLFGERFVDGMVVRVGDATLVPSLLNSTVSMVECLLNDIGSVNFTLTLASSSSVSLGTMPVNCVEKLTLTNFSPIPAVAGAIVTLIGTGFVVDSSAEICLASHLCIPVACETAVVCKFRMPHPPSLSLDATLRIPELFIRSNSLTITLVDVQSIEVVPSLSFPRGGDILTVIGTFFARSWSYRCQFSKDVSAVSAVHISDSILTCSIPPQRPSNTTITIHPGGFSALFRYLDSSPTHLYPSEGPSVGGNLLVVGFSGKIGAFSSVQFRVFGSHAAGLCEQFYDLKSCSNHVHLQHLLLASLRQVLQPSTVLTATDVV